MPSWCTARISRTKRFKCHFRLKTLHHHTPMNLRGKEVEKPHCNKHYHKNNPIQGSRRTDRCQPVLLSISGLSASDQAVIYTNCALRSPVSSFMFWFSVMSLSRVPALCSQLCFMLALSQVVGGAGWLMGNACTLPHIPPSLCSLQQVCLTRFAL